MFLRHTCFVIGAFVFLPLLGCQQFDQGTYDRSLEAVKAAAEHYDTPETAPEAYVMATAVLAAEPDNAKAQVIRRRALSTNPSLERFDDRGLAGMNMPVRAKVEDVSIGTRLAVYPLNLIGEILDILTLEVGGGLGVGAKVQVTEPISAGAQLSFGEALAGVAQGNLSTRATFEEFLDVLMFEMRGLSEGRASLGGSYGITTTGALLKRPSDEIFQVARDYWGIGARAQAAVLSVNLQLHPLQLWDMLAALILIDPLGDDAVVTRRVRFAPDERDALNHLVRQQGAL